MSDPRCANCLYAHWNRRSWLRTLGAGFPSRPLCANHPDTPGQLREVAPGSVCRNYRPKVDTPVLAEGSLRRIPLSNGQFALVDAADFEWLNRYCWKQNGTGYVYRREKGKMIYMHREIMQAPKGTLVDHIDRNRQDNYRSNLRLCTHSENNYNHPKRAGSASSYRGVYRRKTDGRIYSTVYFERRYQWLGFFEDEVRAARAYDRRVVELGITFAYLNFPEEWPPEKRQQVYAEAQPLRDALAAKAAQSKAEKDRKKGGKRQRTKPPTRGSRKRSPR